MPNQAPTRSSARRSRAELGVGLVEVIVVLLIIAIIGAALLGGSRSNKRAGSFRAAQAAGASYFDAIEEFRRNHGGRVPSWGSGDWPSSPLAAARVSDASTPGSWGPVNAGTGGRPYLDRQPEAVADGRTALVGSTASTPTAGINARLAYVRIDARRYRLLVQAPSANGSWDTRCEFGTEGGSGC